jgi:hypothetical protein
LAQNLSESDYAVLKIPVGATESEVHSAWRRRSKEIYREHGETAIGESQLKEINGARDRIEKAGFPSAPQIGIEAVDARMTEFGNQARAVSVHRGHRPYYEQIRLRIARELKDFVDHHVAKPNESEDPFYEASYGMRGIEMASDLMDGINYSRDEAYFGVHEYLTQGGRYLRFLSPPTPFPAFRRFLSEFLYEYMPEYRNISKTSLLIRYLKIARSEELLFDAAFFEYDKNNEAGNEYRRWLKNQLFGEDAPMEALYAEMYRRRLAHLGPPPPEPQYREDTTLGIKIEKLLHRLGGHQVRDRLQPGEGYLPPAGHIWPDPPAHLSPDQLDEMKQNFSYHMVKKPFEANGAYREVTAWHGGIERVPVDNAPVGLGALIDEFSQSEWDHLMATVNGELDFPTFRKWKIRRAATNVGSRKMRPLSLVWADEPECNPLLAKENPDTQ